MPRPEGPFAAERQICIGKRGIERSKVAVERRRKTLVGNGKVRMQGMKHGLWARGLKTVSLKAEVTGEEHEKVGMKASCFFGGRGGGGIDVAAGSGGATLRFRFPHKIPQRPQLFVVLMVEL